MGELAVRRIEPVPRAADNSDALHILVGLIEKLLDQHEAVPSAGGFRCRSCRRPGPCQTRMQILESLAEVAALG
jgi:hypothetical protein